MTIYYIGIPFLMIVAALDATFMKVLQLWGGAPNLMLMVVVAWALLVDIEEALPWAVMGGVMRDLLSVAPTGSSALAFVVIVTAIKFIFPNLSWQNVVFPPLVVFMSTFIYDTVLVVMLRIGGFALPFPYSLLYMSLPGAVANGVLVLIVYRTIGSINAFLRPSKAPMVG